MIDFAVPSREERAEQSRERDERADRRARERFSEEESGESTNLVASGCGVTFKVQGASEVESETNESASERNTLHYERSRSSMEGETLNYEEETEGEPARSEEREPRRINAKNVSAAPLCPL